jgi:hypothetical protein
MKVTDTEPSPAFSMFLVTERGSRTKLVYAGVLPENLSQAWKITLSKWAILKNTPTNNDGGSTTCGLCLFYKRACEKCPIYAYTGEDGCSNTPYPMYNGLVGGKYASVAATKELAFLKMIYRLQRFHLLGLIGWVRRLLRKL